jgi:hypothetical protein
LFLFVSFFAFCIIPFSFLLDFDLSKSSLSCVVYVFVLLLSFLIVVSPISFRPILTVH